MGRRRKAGAEWLPPRVYQGKSAYEFRPKTGQCIKLCPIGATRKRVWDRYNDEFNKLEMRDGSMEQLIRQFLASPAFNDLAARTQKDYTRYAGVIQPVFGKMSADAIKPAMIQQYMDIRGTKSKVQANREHSFMSKVFSWAYARGKITVNPCKGVPKFTEKSRDRYITDQEYAAVLQHACPLLFAAMEISYCCAARQGDVIALTPAQLLAEGILIKQGKTGKAQIKAWTPRLRTAIDTARSQSTIKSINWVLTDTVGQKISGSRLRHWYREAKEKAANTHPELNFDFTFHDIKAKSISDIEGNIHEKQQISGHKTASQVAVYDRKIPVVKTHE